MGSAKKMNQDGFERKEEIKTCIVERTDQPNYKGDFKLTKVDFEGFARWVECPVSLIEKMHKFTKKLVDFGDLYEVPLVEYFIGNYRERCCGRWYIYKDLEIWIGLVFSNVGFNPDFSLQLRINAEAPETVIKRLTDSIVSGKFLYFPEFSGYYFIVPLGKHLIFEQTERELAKEVVGILSNFDLQNFDF